MKKLLLLLATMALFLGCLIKETTHTLVIEQNGSVTWTILEKDIRSDESDPKLARQEEQGYLEGARAGEHSVAVALALLRPDSLDSIVLRESRPISVFTEARFPDLNFLVEEILFQLQLSGHSSITREGNRYHWTLRVYPDDGPEDEENKEESPILALAEDLENYRIFLSQGEFLEAQGFEIHPRGAFVTPKERTEEELENDGSLVFSLVWNNGETDGGPSR